MKTTICIFGDSITYGVSDFERGGWVARLRNYFENKDYEIKIYNLGICGDNTDDLLKRFKVETEARNPDVIILAIGTNDSQYIDSKDNPRISSEKFQENLTELLNEAKDFTQRIIFVGLTQVDESKTAPIPWNTKKYYTNENIVKYNSTIKEFCAKNKLLFINMLDLLNRENLDDGLHPNSQGHQKMFERIRDFLLDNKVVDK